MVNEIFIKGVFAWLKGLRNIRQGWGLWEDNRILAVVNFGFVELGSDNNLQ